MKMIVAVALALVAVVAATPAVDKVPEIEEQQYELQPDGNYFYGFKSDDGTQRKEEGQLKEVLNEDNKPQNVVVVRGSYSYDDGTGQLVQITYEADEEGFRASGPTIPKN